MTEAISPPAEGPRPPVLFVLLMPWGRVGSHLVASAFDNTPGIHVANEPTTAIRTHGHKKGQTLDEIRKQQMRHLRHFAKQHPPGRIGAGLKLSHRSLVDQPAYLRRLSELRFRLVLMVRQNFLKSAVSQMRALARAQDSCQHGAWASPWAVTANEPKPGPNVIDVAEAIRRAGVFKTMHDSMMETVPAIFGTDWKSVEYEDLSVDPEGTIRDIFAYLRLPAPEKIAIRHRKATSDHLEDDIPNYAEFKAAVTTAGLAKYL